MRLSQFDGQGAGGGRNQPSIRFWIRLGLPRCIVHGPTEIRFFAFVSPIADPIPVDPVALSSFLNVGKNQEGRILQESQNNDLRNLDGRTFLNFPKCLGFSLKEFTESEIIGFDEESPSILRRQNLSLTDALESADCSLGSKGCSVERVIASATDEKVLRADKSIHFPSKVKGFRSVR